jgi:hypothetical protein
LEESFWAFGLGPARDCDRIFKNLGQSKHRLYIYH